MKRFIALFLILSALCVVGCGKKMWPEPAEDADRFSWGPIDYTRQQGCMRVMATVQGRVDNLAAVTLELQRLDGSDCPDCPFVPDALVDFTPTGDAAELVGSTLKLSHCGLAPDGAYRFRLQGKNSYRSLGVVISPLVTMPAPTGTE